MGIRHLTPHEFKARAAPIILEILETITSPDTTTVDELNLDVTFAENDEYARIRLNQHSIQGSRHLTCSHWEQYMPGIRTPLALPIGPTSTQRTFL